MDIDFITLRRRSDKILEQLRQTPGSAWRQIQLSNVSRAFRTPKVLERMIQLRDYEVPIRQLAIRDLGHDKGRGKNNYQVFVVIHLLQG